MIKLLKSNDLLGADQGASGRAEMGAVRDLCVDDGLWLTLAAVVHAV